MARVIRKFVDKNFIRTVDLEQLERIIEKYRNSIDYDLAALPKKEQERRQSLYELFRSAGDLFPADLQYALHCICRVASDNGVRLLQARAESGGVVLVPDKELRDDRDGRHLTARHIALRAYLDHRPIFDAVHAKVLLTEPTSTFERFGRRPGAGPRVDEPAASGAFSAAVSAYYASRYQGRYCELDWYPEDGEVNLLVRHCLRSSVLVVEESGHTRPISIREVGHDTVRYRPDAAQIRVKARNVGDAKTLAELFAEHLLDDPAFFRGPGAHELYTLEPIRRHGTSFRMNTRPDEELIGARLIEIAVDDEKVRRVGGRRRSPWWFTLHDEENVLQRLQAVAPELSLSTVNLKWVTIEFAFRWHDREHRVPVRIRPPDSLGFPRDAFEARILQHLFDNGFCCSPAVDHPSATE